MTEVNIFKSIWSYKKALELPHLFYGQTLKILKNLGLKTLSVLHTLEKIVNTTFLYGCEEWVISVLNLLFKYTKDWKVEYGEWTIRVKSL